MFDFTIIRIGKNSKLSGNIAGNNINLPSNDDYLEYIDERQEMVCESIFSKMQEYLSSGLSAEEMLKFTELIFSFDLLFDNHTNSILNGNRIKSHRLQRGINSRIEKVEKEIQKKIGSKKRVIKIHRFLYIPYNLAVIKGTTNSSYLTERFLSAA